VKISSVILLFSPTRRRSKIKEENCDYVKFSNMAWNYKNKIKGINFAEKERKATRIM
jgi:hypothetical protein